MVTLARARCLLSTGETVVISETEDGRYRAALVPAGKQVADGSYTVGDVRSSVQQAVFAAMSGSALHYDAGIVAIYLADQLGRR